LRTRLSPKTLAIQVEINARTSTWITGLLAIALSGCATSNGPRIDNIPMYGQPDIPRPDFMKRGDEAFIREAVKPFNGSRELGSKAWAKEADRFFRNADLDYAMRRHNQAWLLDDKNYLSYWGFGQVMMVREQYDDAIRFYEKAKSLIDDDYQKPALYTDLGLAYSHKARGVPSNEKTREQYFDLANGHFQRSSVFNRKYPTVWEAWANSLYHERKYPEACQKVKTAKEVGQVVQPRFLERLRSAMEEPE
jgi:tetratricopeptide (TPR) repeat protein